MMTTRRRIAVAWLLAFCVGGGLAWYVSGLTAPDRDDHARVPSEYAADISTARAGQPDSQISGSPTGDGESLLAAEGDGPRAVGSLALDDDSYLLHLTYEGDGLVSVRAQLTTRDQQWVLVERTGSWQGAIALDPPVAGVYDLYVDAAGPWSLRLDSARKSPP